MNKENSFWTPAKPNKRIKTTRLFGYDKNPKPSYNNYIKPKTPFSPVKLSIYPKRNISEVRLIDKNPWGDKDKDKVPNIFDCKPLDRKKQGFIGKQPIKIPKKTMKDIDPGIRKNMKIINKAGFETITCCSGLNKEHKTKESPYVSIKIPEQIVESPGLAGGIFDIPKKYIKDYAPIKRLQQEGKEAGWKSEVSKTYITTPSVTFRLSGYKNIAEEKIKYHPKYLEVQKKITDIMNEYNPQANGETQIKRNKR